MGKPKKMADAAPVDDDDALFQQRAVELKDEGAKLFAARKYKEAAAAYDQGIKLVDGASAVAADLHASRGACFFHLRLYADAVADTTRALKISPGNTTALVHRAKAYAATGQQKKAKADAAAALASDPSDDDAKATMDALEPKKEAKGLGGLGLQPKKKGKDAGGANSAESVMAQTAARAVEAQRQANAIKARQQQMAWGPPITVKAAAGDDVRSVIVPSMISHKDLITSLTRKFPDANAFEVKYTDASGALRPLTSRADFQAAAAAAAERADKSKPTLHGIPSVKLTLVEQGADEAPATATGDAATGDADMTDAAAGDAVVEIDEWILDFAALFREHLGIDAEAHLDLHAEGLDKCNEALEPHVSLADAEEMLKIAGDKFQEAAALALFNWGNVHMCGARKAMDGGRDPPLEEGGPPGAAIASAEKYDEVVERLDDAKGRYEAALKVKPDFHDAKIALAQRRYERARLLCAAAGLSGEAGVKNGSDSGHDAEARAKEAEAEFLAAVADFETVLAKLPEEPVKTEEEKKKAEADKAAREAAAKAAAAGQAPKEGEEPPPEPEPSMRAQVQVMWGNTLFEHSQMCARLKKPWRPLLDAAVAKFTDAGCAKGDIDQALKVHRGVRAESK